MAWRIVKQPNGLFARFSDVVDNFTHLDMTHDQALDFCREHMAEDAAQRKVHAAVEDHLPFTVGKRGSGSDRWNDAIETIAAVHGKNALTLKR